MTMGTDIQEFMKEFKELKEKSEKFDNIKKFFGENAEKINQRITEIQQLLAEINPEIYIKQQYSGGKLTRKKGIVQETVAKVIQYLRENPSEELTLRQIQDKWQVTGGGTIYSIKTMLEEHKEAKIKLDPNFKKRVLISYNPNTELPEGLQNKKIVEKVSKDLERQEIAEAMPKGKFSYMK